MIILGVQQLVELLNKGFSIGLIESIQTSFA